MTTRSKKYFFFKKINRWESFDKALERQLFMDDFLYSRSVIHVDEGGNIKRLDPRIDYGFDQHGNTLDIMRLPELDLPIPGSSDMSRLWEGLKARSGVEFDDENGKYSWKLINQYPMRPDECYPCTGIPSYIDPNKSSWTAPVELLTIEQIKERYGRTE